MRYNDIFLEENPFNSYYRNPKRRKRRNTMKNPKMPKNVHQFFQGLDAMDAVSALAGFAGASMLPGLIVKTADTNGKKVGKLLLAAGSTGIVGAAAKSITGSMSGAQAAVAGGLAGTLAQAIGMFTSVTIGNKALASGHATRRIGTSTVVSPSYSREGETVNLITP